MCAGPSQPGVDAPMSDDTLHPQTWARVRLLPDCPGEERKPHHPAEDGARVFVTAVGNPGDHSAFGLYQGAPWRTVMPPPGGLGIGRHFRPDELEALPPDAIDPTPEDDAARRAKLRETMGLPC